MLVRISVEDTKAIISKIKDTWEEVDQRKDMGFKLDPDMELYKQLEDRGLFYCYMLGTIGYAIFLVQPSLHIKGSKTAVSDVIYIRPEHRGVFETYLEEIKKDLKRDGVELISITVKTKKKKTLYGLTSFEESYQGRID